MERGCKVLSALGRPFELGLLYDCRTEQLVPGVSLWDQEKLSSHTIETPKPHSEYKVVASDSISDKNSLLEVDASLSVSLIAGLVDITGSAYYMNDNKTSKKQARVTLKYKTTKYLRELEMNHLRTDISHRDVFKKNAATHVVTAILYGAQAVLVYNQEASESEDLNKVQASIEVAIDKFIIVSASGKGTVELTEEEREIERKTSCCFHGDFHPPTIPATFEAAVDLYQKLPTLLGPKGEKAVPLKVWLLPLALLDSKAARLVRQISDTLVDEAQSILEGFNDLDMRSNDVLKSPVVQQFPQISQKVQTFKALCSEFKRGLQNSLAEKLPAIRGGREDEAKLAEILKEKRESPFSSARLKNWMDDKETEVNTLKALTSFMTNTKIIPSDDQCDLRTEVITAKKAVVFVFTCLGRSEPLLSELEQYIAYHKARARLCCQALKCKAVPVSEMALEDEEVPEFEVALEDEEVPESEMALEGEEVPEFLMALEGEEVPEFEVALEDEEVPESEMALEGEEVPEFLMALEGKGVTKNECELDGLMLVDEVDCMAKKAVVQWYSPSVRNSVTCKAKLFRDFAEANKENKDIRFLAVGLSDQNHQVSALRLYEDGQLSTDNFQPPSAPGAVTVGKVTHNSVSLRFSAPPSRAVVVTGYKLEYQAEGEEEWREQAEDKAGEVTVTELSPNTEYSFRVRALTKVGVGPAAAARGPIRTLEP